MWSQTHRWTIIVKLPRQDANPREDRRLNRPGFFLSWLQSQLFNMFRLKQEPATWNVGA